MEPPFLLVKPGNERDFYDFGEDSPWELLDGRLVMDPASDRHEDLFGFLLTLLSAWLDERGGDRARVPLPDAARPALVARAGPARRH